MQCCQMFEKNGASQHSTIDEHFSVNNLYITHGIDRNWCTIKSCIHRREISYKKLANIQFENMYELDHNHITSRMLVLKVIPNGCVYPPHIYAKASQSIPWKQEAGNTVHFTGRNIDDVWLLLFFSHAFRYNNRSKKSATSQHKNKLKKQ